MSDNHQADAKPVLGTDKCWAGWSDFYIVAFASFKKKSDILMAILHFVLIKFKFRCIGLGDDKMYSKDEVGGSELPADWNLLAKYALRYILQKRLFLLFGYQVGKLLIVNMLNVATMNCSNIAFNTETAVKSTACGKLYSLVPNADRIAGRFFTEVIHAVAYPLHEDRIGCDTPSLYPRTDEEHDPWLKVQSSYDYILEYEEEEGDKYEYKYEDEDDDVDEDRDKYPPGEQGGPLTHSKSKDGNTADSENKQATNADREEHELPPMLRSNTRLKTVYAHMAAMSDFTSELYRKRRRAIATFEGWADLYLDIWNSLRRKSDIIMALYHFIMTKHGFACIGLGDDNSYSETELGSRSLPTGWNVLPKYAIRYVHHKTLYILLGYQVENCLIINLLNTRNKRVSNIALYPDQLVDAARGEGVQNLLPKASYLAELFTDTILKRIEEDTCEMPSRLEDTCKMPPRQEDSYNISPRVEDVCEVLPGLAALTGSKISPFPEAQHSCKDISPEESSFTDSSIYSLKSVPELQVVTTLEVTPASPSDDNSAKAPTVSDDQTRKRRSARRIADFENAVNVNRPVLALPSDRPPDRKKLNPASAALKVTPRRETDVVTSTEQNNNAAADVQKVDASDQSTIKLPAGGKKFKQKIYMVQWSQMVSNNTFRSTDRTVQPKASQKASKGQPEAPDAVPKQETAKDKVNSKKKRKVKRVGSPVKEKDEPKRGGSPVKEKNEPKRVVRSKPVRPKRKKSVEHKSLKPVSEVAVEKALQKLLRRRAKLELDVRRLSTGATMTLEEQHDQLRLAVQRMNTDNQLLLEEQRARLERAIESLRAHNQFLNAEQRKKYDFDLESLNSSGKSERSSEGDSEQDIPDMRRAQAGFERGLTLSEQEKNLTLSAKFVKMPKYPKKMIKDKTNLRPRRPKASMSFSNSKDRWTHGPSNSSVYRAASTRQSAKITAAATKVSRQPQPSPPPQPSPTPQPSPPPQLSPPPPPSPPTSGPLAPKPATSPLPESEPLRKKIKFATAGAERLAGYASYLQSKTCLSEDSESAGSAENAFSLELAALRELLTPSTQKPDNGTFVDPIDTIPWPETTLTETDIMLSIKSAKFVEEEEIMPKPEIVAESKNEDQVECAAAPVPPQEIFKRATDTSPNSDTSPTWPITVPPPPQEMTRHTAGVSPDSATPIRLTTAPALHSIAPPHQMARRTAGMSAVSATPKRSSTARPSSIWETEYSTRSDRPSLFADMQSRPRLKRLEHTNSSHSSELPTHAWADPEFAKIVAASNDALMRSNFNARRRLSTKFSVK